MEDAADEFDNYLPAGEVEEEDIIDALVDLTIDETKEPEIVASASLLAAQNLDLESDSQVVAISKLHIDDWLEMTAPTATIEMLRGNKSFCSVFAKYLVNTLVLSFSSKGSCGPHDTVEICIP